MSSKHTIKDVAAAAEVSAMTVSRVFRRDKHVSPATAELVLEAARRLNYHPDASARALRGCATNSIGVIASNTLWSARTLRNISKPLLPLGYTIFYSDSLGDEKLATTALNEFAGSRMDAILLEWRDNYKTIQPKIERMKNVIIFGFDNTLKTSCDFCHIDIKKALCGALNKLRAAGKRNIWQLCPQVMRFRHIFDEFGLQDNWIDTSLFHYTSNESENHLNAFIDFLSRGGKADAVFCDNDTAAGYLCRYLQSQNIRVPEDVAVIGFADNPLAQFTAPSLSSIDINPLGLGETLARAAIHRLKNPAAPKQELVFEAQFIERESSK